MRPENLRSRIFVDGGDPAETKEIRDLLGFLDGQTTNPTLISHNPEVQARLARGETSTEAELYEFYREVVTKISSLIPDGSVSIEVYADETTSTDAILEQGRQMFTWIPNAHVKFPSTTAGLAAAEQAVEEGLRVNLTLCFSQPQAAATYVATQSATQPHQVFVSPFVGRLDDRGENGMDVVKNILQMYQDSDHHVEVLAASIRKLDHLLYSLALGADIITVPAKILREWHAAGLPVPDQSYRYDAGDLSPIPYQELDLGQPWQSFDLHHDLTSTGIATFSADWKALLG